MKKHIVSFLLLLITFPVFAPSEVHFEWKNSAGLPETGIYEMEISYDNGTTWTKLFDNIPASPGETSSVMVPIINRQFIVRVRVWDSPEKNFYSLWGEPSDPFMVLEAPGKPTVIVIIK